MNLTTEDGGTVTLYAQWTQNTAPGGGGDGTGTGSKLPITGDTLPIGVLVVCAVMLFSGFALMWVLIRRRRRIRESNDNVR